jgi:hypothetical protein
MIISLSEIKSHLRIDHADSDSDLMLYIEAAEADVANFLNRSLTSWGPEGSPVGGSPSAAVPEPVRHAIKMIVGDLYENREAAGAVAVQINPTCQRLLFPYRIELGV